VDDLIPILAGRNFCHGFTYPEGAAIIVAHDAHEPKVVRRQVFGRG